MIAALSQCRILCTSGFCLLQVAPVTYLRLSSYPKLYTVQGRTLSAFPLGMSLTFIVEFYNNIGEKFHTHNTRLYMALNRYGGQRGVVSTVTGPHRWSPSSAALSAEPLTRSAWNLVFISFLKVIIMSHLWWYLCNWECELRKPQTRSKPEPRAQQ